MRRRKLCFNCKESWELGHRCLGKGKIHYIEVMSDSEEDEEPRVKEDDQKIVKEGNINHVERIIALVH